MHSYLTRPAIGAKQADMAQQQAAAQVAKLLSRVGRWGIILGVGGSALQASLYTGEAAKLPRGQT